MAKGGIWFGAGWYGLRVLDNSTIDYALAKAGIDDIIFSRVAIPETIKVNGNSRPTRNSKGYLIYPTKDGIRKFWEWFDDVGAG